MSRKDKLKEKYNRYIRDAFSKGKTKKEVLNKILEKEKPTGIFSPIWFWVIKTIIILLINEIFAAESKKQQ